MPNSCTESTAGHFSLEEAMTQHGHCRLRRMCTRSTRQDAQINYMSTLTIFVKQRTYLATLPNPHRKTNECHCL